MEQTKEWTRTAFVSMRKDVLPPHHINSVIYKYTCSCGSVYIGRTSNRLDLRIKQHLPGRILNQELKRGQLVKTPRSPIADHMINNRECVVDLNVDRFRNLSRSHFLYHLKVLETLYVRSLQPFLCKQRDCLLGLNVISLKLLLISPTHPFFLLFSLSSSFSPLHSSFNLLVETIRKVPVETGRFILF